MDATLGRVDISNHALVVIDLQRRVIAQSTAPHSTADVVGRVERLASAFRRCGLPVVFVRTVNPDRPDTSGDEIEPKPNVDDLVVTKHQWAAFHGTPLDLHLRRRRVCAIVLAGVMTNFGVEGTARAADELGYGVVLVEDASSSVTAAAHEFALCEIFPRLGATISDTNEVLRALHLATLESAM